MSKIKAEGGIEMPKIVRNPGGRPTKYPWQEMEIGESFELACKIHSGGSHLGHANRRYAPKKYESRMMPNGKRRIWRIE